MQHGVFAWACLACLGHGLGAHCSLVLPGSQRVEEADHSEWMLKPLKTFANLLLLSNQTTAFNPSGLAAPLPAVWANCVGRRMPDIKMDATSDLFSRAEFLRTAFFGLPLGLRLAVPFAASFRIGAALSVIGQPRMPELKGPYSSVGVRLVEVPGGCRAKVFYPAERAEGLTDALYCTDRRETSDGMAGLVGFRQIGLSFLLAHLADAQSGCQLNAPPAGGEKLPLLVYSHGFGGNMDMATYFMRQLASFGVIVAALEHRDGTSSHTVLADGTEQEFNPRMLSGSEQVERRATELLAAAKPGVLGKDLAIEESRVFLGGHSYGGPAALRAAKLALNDRTVPTLAGLLLHDPALGMGSLELRRDLATGAYGCPVVSFTSDEYDRGGVRCGTTYHVNGCFHGNFVDAALWAPLWVMRPLSTVIPAAGPGEPGAIHALLARIGARFMQNPGEDPGKLGQDEMGLERRS